MAGYEKLARARAAFRALIFVRVKGTLQRCLDRTREDPKKVVAHRWAGMIMAAGDLMSALRVQHEASKPDPEKIKAAIRTFETTASKLEALSEEARKSAGFDHWRKDDVDEFVASAVAFIKSGGGRRVRIWRGADRHGVDGTFERVLSRYNELLREAIHLKECGRLPQCEDAECPQPR